MFTLGKESTASTPKITIDEGRRYMSFRGESFHENVLEFYAEIIGWLQNYMKTSFISFTFDCELRYFNSSTAKMLLNMLLLMDEASIEGNQVTVNWITTADNEINRECGEDFSEEVENLTFNIILRDV